jgi:predicted nuclease of predicted toxin-antitoxin system
MRLLLDENLSHRILLEIADLFPGSAHVKTHDLLRTDDEKIWDFAKRKGFAIISKDSDSISAALFSELHRSSCTYELVTSRTNFRD